MFRKTILAILITLPAIAQNPTPNPTPRGHSVTTRTMAKRGWLGIGFEDLTPERVKALKLRDESGVEVTHVEDNSPAAKAGLNGHK